MITITPQQEILAWIVFALSISILLLDNLGTIKIKTIFVIPVFLIVSISWGVVAQSLFTPEHLITVSEWKNG